MAKFQPGQSGNPKGRPKGLRAKRTEIIDAVKKEFGSETEFWQHIAQEAKGGDNECLRILANRLRPALKSVAPTFTAQLEYDSLEASLESIIREVAAGKIPSDQARDLITAAKDVAAVTRLVEFGARLDMLEEERGRLKAI